MRIKQFWKEETGEHDVIVHRDKQKLGCSNKCWHKVCSVLISLVSAQHKCRKCCLAFHVHSICSCMYVWCVLIFTINTIYAAVCMFVPNHSVFIFCTLSLALSICPCSYSLFLCVCASVFESAMTWMAGHVNRTLLIFARNTAVVLVLKCFKHTQ